MKFGTKKAFINGKIYTSNEKNPWAKSVVTLGNRILFVGSDTNAAMFIDSKTEVFDLQKKLMLPGFIDSHLHFMEGGFSLMNIDLSNICSKKEFQGAVKTYINTKRPKWVVGGNWDHQKFDEKNLPNKEWIDSITGNIPVFVTRCDLHMGLANSKALELAGINKNTPNPEGGVIEKDRITLELTGILKDNAMQKVFEIIPVPSEAECFEALVLAMREANKNGITSVHDVVYPKDYTVYQEYMKRNKLSCRINLIRPINDLENFTKLKIQHSFGSEYLRMGTLKAFADGSLGSGTAWLFEPYVDDIENYGLPMDIITDGRLRKWAVEADHCKLQLMIHAIGDRAISEILDIYEEVIDKNPAWDRRLRLEHVQHIRKEDIYRMKKLDVIASVQPYHLCIDGTWCEKKIGKERLSGTYAFKSLIDTGIKVSFGSDWSAGDLNPMKGIYAAVARRVDGMKFLESWIPGEKISVEEAVKCYTINAAYTSFEEDLKGSIEMGKFADLVIISDNIFEIEPEQIKEVHIEHTIFDGKIVYSR
ncbi:MAG: amidohydrolase [Ignavibacteria bacterium RBG_13_36_8]|nr:MAG: amidohydrolase [Ignavibacteria bacterium RBG_13_36_8]